MKRASNVLAALAGAVLIGGCLFPRYTTIGEDFPDADRPSSMSVAEASATVREMILNVPAGHHPDHPGDRALGSCITSIRLRKHNRTGLVLVEAKSGSRVVMEFYVRTREDGEKFAAAVWRLRREYRGR